MHKKSATPHQAGRQTGGGIHSFWALHEGKSAISQYKARSPATVSPPSFSGSGASESSRSGAVDHSPLSTDHSPVSIDHCLLRAICALDKRRDAVVELLAAF